MENVSLSIYSIESEQMTLMDFCIKSLGLSKSLVKKHLIKKAQKKLLFEKDIVELPIDLLNNRVINPNFSLDTQEVKIVFEDSFLIALSKPEKIHMHPLSYSEMDNLCSYLRATNKIDSLLVNQSEYDRGFLYRLDYDTSGVVVALKDEDAFFRARKNFNDVAKSKKYLAIVDGRFEKIGKYISTFHSRGEKGREVYIDNGKSGPSGGLEISKVSYDEKRNISLLEIDLKTGLRHQIRVQLSELGFPIIGDTLYGGRSEARLYLHAYQYEIDIDGKIRSFKDENLRGLFSFFNQNCIF